MRVLYLVPGSGGTFYCQNCLRDLALVRAMRALGHDAVVAPLYLPMYGDDLEESARAPLFFGGVNVFLRESFPVYRKAPRWLEQLLDNPWMLARAAEREGSTNAAELGPMTLSMLRALDGGQRREYERFLAWLRGWGRPDVIHISNALLLGFVPAIREASNVPLVCSLQDEEPWVNAMRSPYDRLCWEAMARDAARVHAFVSTSRWYADRMAVRLDVPRDRIAVVYPGVDAGGVRPPGERTGPPVIGYLARLSESLGLGKLVDAFIRLRHTPECSDARLLATGGVTTSDASYVDAMERRLRGLGLAAAAELHRDFKSEDIDRFYAGISVLSVPVPGGEAFSLPLLEAMARGIPVVQPAAGAYPEIVEATGGGMICEDSEDALADALRMVLCDRTLARALGERGRKSVSSLFTLERSARDMTAVYDAVLKDMGP